MNIYVAMPVTREHIDTLKAACPEGSFIFAHVLGSADERCEKIAVEPNRESIMSADVIVGNVPVGILSDCTRLRLLQLNMAGSDAYAGRLPVGAKLANASGAYGLAISEHMLGMLLMLMKKLDIYRDNQNAELWRDEGCVTSIEGAVVLVVGLGDIGGEFAMRCKKLGAYCIGIRRSVAEKPAFADEMYTLGELDSLIPRADVIALALPNSEESRGLMNEERLLSMKRGSILLNVGRGNAVDTEALVRVLNSGHIKAGLDVTDPEPLPTGHPLWSCPGVMITPHISGYYHLKQTHDRIIEIAAANIKNLIEGKPILNAVDSATGYRQFDNRFSSR